jgi:flagellin-like hook-associated protein FlgL
MSSVNTNLGALTAQANMQKQAKEMDSAMQRRLLSSSLV